MFVGRRLHERRKLLGFSQEDLASKVGISKSTLQVWETGKSDPAASKLERVAHALGVTVDFFMNGLNKDAQPLSHRAPEGTPSFF